MEVSDVLTCVRVLAESMACLPLDLYVETSEGAKKDKEHSLQELVRWQPNPEMSSYDLRLWMMVDVLLRGNGAAQVLRDGNGKVLELWPLFSSKLKAKRKDSTGELVFTYPLPDDPKGEAVLEPNEVLLIKAFSSGELFSPSLISLAADTLGGGKAAQNYANEFFANGAVVSGTIQYPHEMDDEMFDRLKKDWQENYSGEGSRHKTPILEGGATFNPIQLNHEQTQLLESRKYSRSQVAGLFRVPAHLINDLEKATFSNIEHQDLGFVKHCLRPWMCNWEQRMRMTLLTPEERKTHFFKHNANDLLRGDLASRYSAYAQGIQNGILSPNDARRKEDEPTYEDGNVYVANSTLKPVNKLGE